MTYIFILVLVSVVLLWIVLRRPPYPTAALTGLTKGFFYAALVMIGLYIAFFIFFGVGEMTGGDLSGMAHFFPVVILILITWLAWRRPFETGWGLIVVGVLAVLFFAFATRGRWADSIPSVVFGGIPFIIPGILLILAVRKPAIQP